MLNVLIKALRNKATELNNTADSLERLGNTLGPLFDDSDLKKQKASRAIIKRINEKAVQALTPDFAIANYIEPQKKSNPMKGKTYPKGTHWTQKPENATKLKRVVKIMTKINKAKV